MIKFNERGYIEPTEIIDLDIIQLEKIFVHNEHRQGLFQEYLLFLNELKGLNLGSFYQWINGSFVTQKTKPNDIDVVTFVDYLDYDRHIQYFEKKYNNRYKSQIDCYFVQLFPDNHNSFSISKGNSYYFLEIFSLDFKKYKELERRNRKLTKETLKKGFIKIQF